MQGTLTNTTTPTNTETNSDKIILKSHQVVGWMFSNKNIYSNVNFTIMGLKYTIS